MWFAFVIVITASQVGGGISPVPFQTKEECVAKNQEVENRLFKRANAGQLVYHFDCIKLEPDDFKKPGLDA